MAEGHRERMRERILNGGIKGLQEHEVLEYLLYSFIPRKDTNNIAHELIQKFGSLSKVLEAEKEDLESVANIGSSAALFLSSLLGVYEKYKVSKLKQNVLLNSHGLAMEYVKTLLFCAPDEQVYMLCLDSKMKLIKEVMLSDGVVNKAEISTRKLIKTALLYNSTSVILAHNHPSGELSPSLADISFTKTAYLLLCQIGIKLLDHIIVSGENSFSFKGAGIMDPIIKTYSNILQLSEKELEW